MNDLHCLWCLEPFNETKEEVKSKFQISIGDDIMYCIQYKSGWMKKRLGDNEFYYICPNHESEEVETEATIR